MKNKLKKLIAGSITGLALFLGVIAFSAESDAAELLRVYNPNSGEHFYTHDANERNHLVGLGWHNEGTAWETPDTGIPVHRLYNPNSGDHHYTIDVNESNMLRGVGWNYECVAWQSGGTLPVFRLYNPNAKTGTHHYTLNGNERDHLDRIGWNYEGIAFYAVDKNAQKPTPPPKPSTPTPVDSLGNSGVLEKTLIAADKVAQQMWSDENGKFYMYWHMDHEPNSPYIGYGYRVRAVKMSNNETWYTVDFYPVERTQ